LQACQLNDRQVTTQLYYSGKNQAKPEQTTTTTTTTTTTIIIIIFIPSSHRL
jgi:hypothetical protein